MADSNELRFHKSTDRVLGGIPNKAARANTRVADSQDIADLPDGIIYKKVARYNADGTKATDTSLGNFLKWIDSGLNTLMAGINRANEGIAGLTAAVTALGEKQGIDPVQLEKIVAGAVKNAVGTYELRKVGDE